jgi:hypothetical protein
MQYKIPSPVIETLKTLTGSGFFSTHRRRVRPRPYPEARAERLGHHDGCEAGRSARTFPGQFLRKRIRNRRRKSYPVSCEREKGARTRHHRSDHLSDRSRILGQPSTGRSFIRHIHRRGPRSAGLHHERDRGKRQSTVSSQQSTNRRNDTKFSSAFIVNC